MTLPDMYDIDEKEVKRSGRDGVECCSGACVACGRVMEGVVRWEMQHRTFYSNHHCDDRVVSKRNTMMDRGRQHHDRRGWADRLSEGHFLLRLS
jgi:hypothetical protein